MYGAKKIVSAYKGIFSLVLMLFFVVSAFGKGVAVKNIVAHKHGKETAYKYWLNAIESDDDTDDFSGGLANDDTDDTHFVLPDLVTAPKPLSIQGSNAKMFAIYAPGTNFYDIALYDLYCNWKFHL